MRRSRRMMAGSSTSRLAYIDWARGFACLVMFQTHCYDSWLSPEARKTTFFMWSQLGGTLPAPLFLFLAGISVGLITDKLLRKGVSARQIAMKTIRRGGEVFVFGLLFRLQEYVISWGWAPWSDLFRVDILNTIGISMVLMGLAIWIVLALFQGHRRLWLGIFSVAGALKVSLLSPLLWTNWRPDWLPWPIESYINGVHNLGVPQPWLFPIFPWTAFAFAGLAIGLWLFSDGAVRVGAWAFAAMAALAALLIEAGTWMANSPFHLYATDDFWHTSPNFFLIRVGLICLVLSGAYFWCRWGAGQWGFSPLAQMGQTSLLVYWVHIEFVYGRFTILPRHAETIGGASVGLLIIFVAMLVLSILRTRFEGRGAEMWAWIRRPVSA